MQRETTGGLAARAGRWSARHRKTAILGWLAFVAIALVAGTLTGTNEPTDADTYDGESRRAQTVLADAGFPSYDVAGEVVLVQSRTATIEDPGFRAAVRDAERAVAGQAVVENVVSPLGPDGQVSRDGRSALVEFEIAGDADDAQDKVAPVMAAVERVAAAHAAPDAGLYGPPRPDGRGVRSGEHRQGARR